MVKTSFCCHISLVSMKAFSRRKRNRCKNAFNSFVSFKVISQQQIKVCMTKTIEMKMEVITLKIRDTRI